MKFIKRILKDFLWFALFVLLFNMFFSGRDQTFSFSLMIACIIYFWISFFRFIFFLFGLGSLKKDSDANPQPQKKQNNNNKENNVAKTIYYDDMLFHDKYPHHHEHHDHFND